MILYNYAIRCSPTNALHGIVGGIHYLTQLPKLIYVMRDPVEYFQHTVSDSNSTSTKAKILNKDLKGFHNYIANALRNRHVSYLMIRASRYVDKVHIVLKFFFQRTAYALHNLRSM